jgi:predicted acetyltransferase
MLFLQPPGENDSVLWENFIGELIENGEKIIPAALSFGCEKYCEYLQKVKDYERGKNLPNDLVPCSVYFLFNDKRDKILGCIVIRHKLNDALRFSGGNIGYSVPPSERGKGYAKEMLRLALDKCRQLGINRILLTCDKENTASSRTMKANGAVLFEEFVNTDGFLRERYRIEL